MQKASFEVLQQGCRHPDPNFRPFSKSPWLFLTSHLACIRFNCPMMQFRFFFLKWLCRDSVCTCTVMQIKLVVVVSRSREIPDPEIQMREIPNPEIQMKEIQDPEKGNRESRNSNLGKSRVPIFK